MNTKKYLLIAILAMIVGTQSFAAKGYKKVRWGLAGCGPGAMFIDKNEMFPQIGAWFVNRVLGSQTFGITSGTSNCTDKQFKDEARIEQEVFISSNFDSLSKEAAQGTGEHLDALAEVFGCDAGKLARLSQENHGVLFSNGDAKTAVGSFIDAIKADSELSKSCERVG